MSHSFNIGVMAVHRDNTSSEVPADANRKRFGALKASQYGGKLVKVVGSRFTGRRKPLLFFQVMRSDGTLKTLSLKWFKYDLAAE